MFQDTGSDVGGRYPLASSGMRLITQRSQVQILPPLQVKLQVSNLESFGLAVAREDSAGNLRVRGPFSLRGGRASCVVVNGWSTWRAAEPARTTAHGAGSCDLLRLLLDERVSEWAAGAGASSGTSSR